MTDKIEGIKIIYANTYNIRQPDDPSYPYKLTANFRPPEMMRVTFVMMHGGSEEIVIRGMTKEALLEVVKTNEWKGHPRLRRLTIEGPEGVEEIK